MERRAFELLRLFEIDFYDAATLSLLTAIDFQTN